MKFDLVAVTTVQETLTAARLDALQATIGRARDFLDLAAQHGYFRDHARPRAPRADIDVEGDDRYASVDIGITAIEKWVTALELQCRQIAAEAEAASRASLERLAQPKRKRKRKR